MDLFEYIDVLNQPYDIFTTTMAGAPMHWHYYCEILYVMAGSLKIISDKKTEVIEKGEMTFIYPLQFHKVRIVDEDVHTEYAVIKFDIQALHIPQVYASQLRRYFTRPIEKETICTCFHCDDMELEGMDYLIRKVVREFEKKEALYYLQIQSHLCTLLVGVMRTLQKRHPVPEPDVDNQPLFFEILEYIDAHASEPLSVEKLADMCHMSYSYFARRFHETYGRSCKDYINYIRVLRAQEFLLNTDYNLDYIAQETGFYDASHFIRTYKKIKGVTPKQERIHLKKQNE